MAPKLSGIQVSKVIIQKILDSQLSVEDSLGTKEDLLLQYRVSFPALKEGIGILVAQGVVYEWDGKSELQIKRPTAAEVLPSVVLLAKLNRDQPQNLLNILRNLSPALSKAACTNASQTDLDELKRSAERLEGTTCGPTFAVEFVNFHVSLAHCSGSAIFELFWLAINKLITSERHVAFLNHHEQLSLLSKNIADAVYRRSFWSARLSILSYLAFFEKLTEDAALD